MSWRLCDADWNHWPDGLDDASVWAACAEAGFSGVELGVYRAADQLAPERVARVGALAARHRLPVAMVLLSLPPKRWPGGALSSEAAVPAVAAEAVATARVAAGWGVGTLGLWPGADPPGAPWEAVVAGTAAVAEALRPTGVRLAVEYKPGTAVADADDALGLCRAVPGVGVLLDTAHAFAALEDPAAVVRRAGDLLWHLHLGDASPGHPEDDLPVGRLHDFAAVVGALAATGYAGAASLDLYGAVSAGRITGVAAARQSRDHLLGCRS
ncbi:MAG: sugar phosphate isomerase/epimerase family protein [Acidimicrobiales bacterium]